MVSDGYGTPKDCSDMPEPGEHGNRKTATIVTTSSGGTFHSADCPYCGRSYILSRELSILQKFCLTCSRTFELRWPDEQDTRRATEIQVENHEMECAEQDARDENEWRKPFNPPPAKPRIPDYPRGDPRRGPRNWPVHYDGSHR
jgi:uncharacterized Zn-finger protein